MLRAITVLLLFQLVGEVLARSLDLPIPGPVIGMLLLLGALLLRGEAPKTLRDTAQGLLSHLALLFVPAGVGVMAHVDRLQDEWLAILVTLVLSTLLTLVLTAWAMRLLLRLTGGAPARKGDA
jgi:holin-like protein